MRRALVVAIGVAMLAGLPTHAADQPDDLTIAREFFAHTSAGNSVRPLLEETDDNAAARKLINYCALTPAAKMPRLALKGCESFDDWRKAYLHYGRDSALEGAKMMKLLETR